MTTQVTALSITSIQVPIKGGISLTIPTVEGYILTIFSSSKEYVIKIDGTITPPLVEQEVELILTLSNVVTGQTANTLTLKVIVPSK